MHAPRMLAKTAYEWPFEICEMNDPRPKMVLCTEGHFFEDAEAERIGLTAYLAKYDAEHGIVSKAVQQSEVEDKAVAGPLETKADEPPVESPESDETPNVIFPPEVRRTRGR